jgi:hypothetical protein
MPTPYEEKIIKAFKDICANSVTKENPKGHGASPAEVVAELAERKELSDMDSVIDIADIMKDLRNRGLL